jgi:hypothetical protein
MKEFKHSLLRGRHHGADRGNPTHKRDRGDLRRLRVGLPLAFTNLPKSLIDAVRRLPSILLY